ncbi:MAG: glutaredoxin [Candidatus Aenigmarchaeota archaeon]|nr:glutaredoxin [Candidatus Aenigmarchaeota archaeon]
MKTKFIILVFILAAIIGGCVSIESSTPEESDSQFKENEILYFYYPGCPHCAHAKEVLDSLKTKYGDTISVKEINVNENTENEDLYNYYFEKSGASVQGVPFIFINNHYIVGWTNDNEAKLESYVIK